MNDWKELMLGQVNPRYARALTRHEPFFVGDGFDETKVLLTADQVLVSGDKYKNLLSSAASRIQSEVPRRVRDAKRAYMERLEKVEARVATDRSLPPGFTAAKEKWLRDVPKTLRFVREYWTNEARRLQALASLIQDSTRYFLTRHEVEELTGHRELINGAVGVGQLQDALSPWDPPATPGDALP